MREAAGAALDPVSPDASFAPNGARRSFRVTEALVARFAALTGDHSQLHVDDAMARRTAYRRRVAHGMLPVGMLAASRPLHRDGLLAVPVALSGRFLAPVYAGDRLTLVVGDGRPVGDSDRWTYEYRIEKLASSAAVTIGEVTLRYSSATTLPNGDGDALGESSLLAVAPPMRAVPLEAIEVGMAERLDFQISAASAREFAAMIAGAFDDGMGADEVLARADVATLLAILLFSTSVGVVLPGAHATFLDFSAQVEQPVRVGASYSLTGEVVHRSRGTRIVKKQLVVRDRDDATNLAVTGRVTALANKPASRMPSMEEVRDTGVDLGLTGKVVVITGASRGIGETTAKFLALCGAAVIVNYHRGADDAKRVVSEITDAGGTAEAIAADVTNERDVAALVAASIDQFGRIDVLVNNAVRDFRPIPFAQLTWDEIQKDLDVIAKGAFLCCQRVIPTMVEHGGGKIVNIASVATDDPPADQTKYVMAKSALVGLTRSLSVELAAKNIQVNMVVPSFVETDLVAHVQEGFRRKIARETPMGRNASPIDVARAVAFLASSYASFTTGQKIMVTGGGAPYA